MKVYLLLLLLIFSPYLKSQDAEEVLAKTKALYQNIKNGKLSISRKFKPVYKVKDTTYATYDFTFMKDRNKLDMKLRVYQYNYQAERIYDGKNIYFIRHKDNTIELLPNKKPFYRGLALFYEDLPIREEFFDNLSTEKKIITQQGNLYKLIVGKYLLTINATNYQIESFEIYTLHNDGIQYASYQIKSQDFNQPKFEENDLYNQKSLFPHYTKYEMSQHNQKSTLSEGSLSPDWKAVTIAGDSIQLSDLRGKVVFLDFWYQSCKPCVDAIPEVEALYQKYKTNKDVVFFGVNPYDKNLEDLSIFIKKKEMNYPIIWQASTVSQLYEIHAYPTLMLIDKEGKIIYKKNGFTNRNFNSVDKIIMQQIEQ